MSELITSEIFRPQPDLGTAAPALTGKKVSLLLDGASIEVAEGTSVLRAAASAGINIPKLCATDSLDAFGSCRMCLVEIEGRRGYPASCTTLAEEGMVVKTQSEKLGSLRDNILELYVSDHPLECVSCPSNGDCELQDVAEDQKAGMVHSVFTNVASKYDVMNDVMSGGVHRLWKAAMMDWLAPRRGMKLLDVAGGTGDISFRFLKRAGSGHATVFDMTQSMLDAGLR